MLLAVVQLAQVSTNCYYNNLYICVLTRYSYINLFLHSNLLHDNNNNNFIVIIFITPSLKIV